MLWVCTGMKLYKHNHLCISTLLLLESVAQQCTATCPAGTYRAINDGFCTSCLAGTYSETDGAKNCTSCLAGTYSATVGADSSSTCQSCLFDMSWTGDSACSCVPGLQRDDDNTVCKPCGSVTYQDSYKATCKLCV